MAAPSYITLDQLKDTLGIAGFTAGDTVLTQQIATASRAVDLICGRRFYLLDDSNEQTRYYTPLRPIRLEIDDLAAEPSSVLSDQDGDGVFETTWTLHTDYELAPDNADLDGVPWERIVLNERSATVLPVGLPRSVQVTGIFGWSEVPDGVITLTTLLAARLVMRVRNAPFGVVSLGAKSAARIAKQDPDMMNLVSNLIRNPIFVG
jgi:hypothetical protein